MKYTGEHLREIIFPLGGIGTGSVGLAGNGALVDFEIFNRPNKGSINDYSCFAVKAEYPDGRSVVKVLQGDHKKDLMGQYRKAKFTGYGYGPGKATMCGYPHFEKVKFDGKFPIATLTFEDAGFPARVVLRAFNPFIPLNADNSGLPAAFFEVEIESREEDVRYTVVLSMRNPFAATENRRLESADFTAVQLLHHGLTPTDRDYGDLTVAVDKPDGICQEYWYRGGWQDKVTTFWRELCDGELPPRHYDTPDKGDLCSVGASVTLGRKKRDRMRFLLTWNLPNNYNYWKPCTDAEGRDVTWKNYYAVLFESSAATCAYAMKHWDRLYRETARFTRALHTATLDPAVIDAVSSTLSVLKSPTVLRLEDGSFYGWEGVHELEGSCEGTCTHVWSYAYALCFLFPELERSLRDTEFKYDTDERGEMQFRTKLPLGVGRAHYHPCVDGQMATVIKIYRDWRITGNSTWLRENWENVKRILEFAWSPDNPYEWDRDKDGVLEGRQHHTLDMELFGPSAWLEGMYLAALKAAAEMADFLGDGAKRDEYRALFKKGCAWTRENLFNGRYFFHKVDLKNKAVAEHFDCLNYWNEEKGQLKYQIGEGCEIDQLLGQWHASLCGLGDVFDKEQRQIALGTMAQSNFKPSLREFANMWRVFALNDEGGTVICDYPNGAEKPIIPIPYCEECMTGFEYALAGLWISEGMIDEGLRAVRAIRHRYDGKKRNPYNEIECGSNYARPMASFALLPIFSGFTFDLPHGHIGFSPIVKGDFKCLWSLGCGWGEVHRKASGYRVTLAAGSLTLDRISLGGVGAVRRVLCDGRAIDFKQNGEDLLLGGVTVKKELKIEAE